MTIMRNIYHNIRRNTALVIPCVIFVCILAVTTAIHTYNLFGYPYYENDEGIYMSQAHALMTSGRLSPYTYWYDHAPMGWIMLATIAKATGAMFSFGLSVNFGRVVMAVFHLCSVAAIFYIVRRVSKGYFAASMASIIFTLSPLALYYQRRVLLDNMMIALVLGAMAIVYKSRITVRWIMISAVLFGCAVLTKENAIVFIPAMWYGIFSRRKELSQRWVTTLWTAVVGVIVSMYPLYAWVRGELYAAQGGDAHVSLVETLLWQISRTGGDMPFWHADSAVMLALKDWLYHDPYFTVVGLLCGAILVVWSMARANLRVLGISFLLAAIFLFRGGIILYFYIIPLIPFMAIAIALLVERWARYISNDRPIVYGISVCVFCAVIVGACVVHTRDHFTVNETASQVDVVRWVKNNLPADAKIAIDDYAYADYHDARFENTKVFDRADVFWKIESDPQIRDGVYGGDWRNIDHVVTSDTFMTHRAHGELAFVGEAADSAQEIVAFHTTGVDSFDTAVKTVDPSMPIPIVYAHDPALTDQLYRTLRTYKKYFFRTYGQIVDPETTATTSEGQSYAMLRTVWMDDREAFDGVWTWTRDHLQFRTDDKLFSWKWVMDDLADANNATDADEDIALALLFAYAQWGDEAYLTQAREIIADIGEHCVRQINGRYYVVGSHWKTVEQWNGFLLNPSYLSPAHYRIFAQVDDTHDWSQIATDSYDVLDRVGRMDGNVTYLPSDWVLVDKETGAISSARAYFDHDVDRFSYDAFRTLWRVSLDYQWFGTEDARAYLSRVNAYIAPRYTTDHALPSVIAPDGTIVAGDASPAIDAGYLASLMVRRDHALAQKFYAERFTTSYDPDGQYWGGDKYNYYNANWAWFATAMYNGDMKNIFDEKAIHININE